MRRNILGLAATSQTNCKWDPKSTLLQTTPLLPQNTLVNLVQDKTCQAAPLDYLVHVHVPQRLIKSTSRQSKLIHFGNAATQNPGAQRPFIKRCQVHPGEMNPALLDLCRCLPADWLQEGRKNTWDGVKDSMEQAMQEGEEPEEQQERSDGGLQPSSPVRDKK